MIKYIVKWEVFIKNDIFKFFPRLMFQNNDEEKFLENFQTRGKFLYKQVYDALCNWEPGVSIKYEYFKNLIRYDKSIRNKLYIFLCVAEEYLRNIIFDELEINERIENNISGEFDINLLHERNKNEDNLDSNLYFFSYSKFFNFGTIEMIFKKFNLASKYNINQDDITVVRKCLRNKIMHHNMLLLSNHIEKSKIEKEIKEIEESVEALYRLLPTIETKEGSIQYGKKIGGLTLAINKSNYKDGDITQKPYDNLICLHKFENGRFIR